MKKILNVLLMLAVAFSTNAKTGKTCEKCKDRGNISQDAKDSQKDCFWTKNSFKTIFALRIAQNDITVHVGNQDNSHEVIINKGEVINLTSLNIKGSNKIYLAISGEKKGCLIPSDIKTLFDNSKEEDEILNSDLIDMAVQDIGSVTD